MFQIQKFKTQSKNDSARVLFSDQRVLHLHSLVAPQEESRFFPDLQFPHLNSEVVILLGCGLAYHLQDALPKINPQTPIILVELFEECVQTFKQKLPASYQGEILILNSKNQDSHHQLLSDFSAKHSAKFRILRHPASIAVSPEYYSQTLRNIRSVFLSAHKSNATTSKKIALFHGSFFLEEECHLAIQSSEIEPILIPFRKGEGELEMEHRLELILQKHSPQFVLSINLKGVENASLVAEICSQYSIPFCIWFVDDPHPILAAHSTLNPKFCQVFCWEKSYLPFLNQQGFSNPTYLPLAGSPSLFFPESSSLSQSKNAEPVFVGTAMGTSFLNQITQHLPPLHSCKAQIETFAQTLVNNSTQNLDELFNELLRSISLLQKLSKREEIWLRSLLIHTASKQKRQSFLQALLPYSLKIYGDRDWTESLGNQIQLYPPLDYHTQLVQIYRQDCVHINLTSCQMPSAVNQRVFDIPLSGGFLISDQQKDLLELFEENRECIAFSSIDELKEKFEFYAKHPQERSVIIQNARKHILAEHTYDCRIQKMFSVLNLKL